MANHIRYSEKYHDDEYEFRHVLLDPETARIAPTGRLMTEEECRGIGVQQSLGWVHFMIHRPEPHILLFRRPLKKEDKELEPSEK